MIKYLISAGLLLISIMAHATSVAAQVVADDFYKVFVGDSVGTSLIQVGGSAASLWPSQGAPFNFNITPGQYIFVAAWDSASYGPPHMWVGEFDIGSTKLLSNTIDWVGKTNASTKDPSTLDVQELAQSPSPWDLLQVSMPNGSYPYGSLIGGSPANFVWTDTFNGSSASEQGFVLFRTAVAIDSVPELTTYAMMMVGLGLLGFMVRLQNTDEAYKPA